MPYIILVLMLFLVSIILPIIYLFYYLIFISKSKKKGQKRKKTSISQILFFLGGCIVVLAGIIYVGINFSQWGSATRIFTLFLPMFICYSIGASLFFNYPYKKKGLAFVIVGSLLFPLFLLITFEEWDLFTTSFNEYFNLTVSLLTFVLYLGLSFVFRSSIWVLLYQGMGLFVYHYLLIVLGVTDDVVADPTLAFLFLIPGTAYLLLSLLLYEKDKIHYSYVLSLIVFVYSFISLAGWAVSNDNLSWWLIFPGLAYFIFGAWLERGGIKNTISYWIGSDKDYYIADFPWTQKYCVLPYMVGTGFIFFSFFYLMRGTMLKDIFVTINKSHEKDIISWSNVLVGIICLLIAWLISKLKHFQLKEGIKYKTFFNFLGSFLIPMALFYLGSEGKKPIYETLFLLSSLSFIFISIPKKSSLFLYMGTLFLITYIISIGIEYFKDDVGWSVILFVVGLTSMGVSVFIEIVKRRYIKTVEHHPQEDKPKPVRE